MKINLYYDVLLVPPSNLVKEGHEQSEVTRFLKVVSLPTLLVPSQTYQLQYDPVSGNPDSSAFLVVDSGVFENDEKRVPFIVIKDDYWLAFDPWLKHEASVDETALIFKDQIALWRGQDAQELDQVKWRFKQHGWEICSSIERGPSQSRPDFE